MLFANQEACDPDRWFLPTGSNPRIGYANGNSINNPDRTPILEKHIDRYLSLLTW